MIAGSTSTLLLLLVCFHVHYTNAWSILSTNDPMNRREATKAALLGIAAIHTAAVPAHAIDANKKKQWNLSDEALGQIVTKDIVDHQFLTNGRLTRSIYDESATFTDEIDTYQLDQWMEGTAKLFVADKSHVQLVPDSLQVSKDQVTFRFDEYLTFNIPVLQPKVDLTGRVILERDPTTGLILSYREEWDQSVSKVLASAQLFQ